jgi:hypothetical protein
VLVAPSLLVFLICTLHAEDTSVCALFKHEKMKDGTRIILMFSLYDAETRSVAT